METNLTELLVKYRYLLEVDYEELGGTSTSQLQTWANSMTSAIAVTEHMRVSNNTLGSPGSASFGQTVMVRFSLRGSIVYCRSIQRRA